MYNDISLLDFAIKEAIKRRYHSTHLDTHIFQASPFYEKQSYVAFGVLNKIMT